MALFNQAPQVTASHKHTRSEADKLFKTQLSPVIKGLQSISAADFNSALAPRNGATVDNGPERSNTASFSPRS